MEANFENLTDIQTWEGWALFAWDMCDTVTLFDEAPELVNYKPDHDEPEWRYTFQKALTESMDVGLLEDMGYKVLPEDQEKRWAFYYGEDSDGYGQHKPLRIKITAPRAFLELFRLI